MVVMIINIELIVNTRCRLDPNEFAFKILKILKNL